MFSKMITDPDRLWLPPPANLALSDNEVHVWRVSLDLTASQIQSLQHTLAAGEMSWAERFYFHKDRRRFIVTRALLRAILSRYLDVEPGQLRFCYSPSGKPALVAMPDRKTLSFNLSHSHELALVGVAFNREIGIDLELIRTDFPCEQIARQLFSPQENAVLHALPIKMKHEAFFNCWTRKEAYVKARGEGLALPLQQFDVSLSSIRGDPQEAYRWSLRELIPAPGYVAALVVEGHNWRLACWQWPESLS